MTKTLSLERFTRKGDKYVRNLSGHDRGRAVRECLDLSRFDGTEERVVIEIPDYVLAVTGSFFQGLFGESLRTLGGPEGFHGRYVLDARPTVTSQLEATIRNLSVRNAGQLQ
ncbi:MAG: hypothetical protein GDA52_06420 [Rhodobacteraceae bacterium]|nr:hypothetical protein [Paracoccaceae bacterium]